MNDGHQEQQETQTDSARDLRREYDARCEWLEALCEGFDTL